ncbi:V-set and immunoglobulin domain-containing protein 1 isoform X5 [Chelonia mydas]|uniref:V-set and immunoglobulin domain-containing protein 1 isoform X5 n=1 Tax=Chelonia mydas TaxID=8469 RepID=UPI001CA953D5|nr:V-set and immunoglobulin domain-containing protein 1 isoform X5 [Chelonia mydas]
MFATMLKIVAIIAALSGHISSMTVTAPQSMVNVSVGGNATLLCTYTTTGSVDSLFIQWSFYSAKEKQPQTIYYFQNGQAYEYGEFKNRINGTTNQGNASITISNMQPSDTGFYTCEVFNPQDSSGRNQKSVAVSVLVKPSQPHCSLRGTPETGHLVSLSCYSEEGMPVPTYQWYRVSGETLKPMTEQLNTKTGLFIIGNLTTFETGYYRCTASNSLGNSSCEVDLSAAHQCLRNNRQMSNMLIYPPKKMSLLPQLHQAEKLMQPVNTLLLRKLLPLECLKMMRCKEWRHKQEPKNSTAISLSAMDPIFKNVGIELTQEGVWL